MNIKKTILFGALIFIFSCNKETSRAKAEKKFRLVKYENELGDYYYKAGEILATREGWKFNAVKSKKFKDKEKAIRFKDSLIEIEISEIKSHYKATEVN